MGAQCSSFSGGVECKHMEDEDEPLQAVDDTLTFAEKRASRNSRNSAHFGTVEILAPTASKTASGFSEQSDSVSTEAGNDDDYENETGDNYSEPTSKSSVDDKSDCESDVDSVVLAGMATGAAVNAETAEMFRRLSARRKSTKLTHKALSTFAKQRNNDLNTLYALAKGVLASGSFGTVRKATVKATGAVRAVNSIPKSQGEEEMEKVRARIAVTSQFDHPNIVSLHEVFDDKEHVHLVMDCCPGGTLENSSRQISEVKVVFIMQQVLQAIFYMHRNDVCHRDMQPQKVLFMSSSKELYGSSAIKVSGFATSCTMKKKDTLSDIVGRPGYMAPEMVNGCYGRVCDLWSCGVIMFELLCGRLPYPIEDGKKEPQSPKEHHRSSSRRASSQLQNKERAPFSAEDTNVSNSAREIIGLLLEATPSARYSAKQALNHSWFRKSLRKLNSVPFETATVAQLSSFRKQSALQQAAFRIIATHLSDAETVNSRKLFVYLDKDGDGKLTPRELAKDPELAKQFPEVAEVFRNADEADDDPQPSFTYTEFVAATFDRQQCITPETCRIAFNCLDRNGDGWVSESKFAADVAAGNADLAELGSAYVDAKADRKIKFEEFMLTLQGDNC